MRTPLFWVITQRVVVISVIYIYVPTSRPPEVILKFFEIS